MKSIGECGSSLIEALVSVLVGMTFVVGTGVLVERLIQHRVASSSNWDAVRLAERKIESLRSMPDPSTHPDLANGSHGPFSVTRADEPALGGAYRVWWDIADDVPHTGSKRITVGADHANDPRVSVTLTTYYVVK